MRIRPLGCRPLDIVGLLKKKRELSGLRHNLSSSGVGLYSCKNEDISKKVGTMFSRFNESAVYGKVVANQRRVDVTRFRKFADACAIFQAADTKDQATQQILQRRFSTNEATLESISVNRHEMRGGTCRNLLQVSSAVSSFVLKRTGSFGSPFHRRIPQ